MAGRFELFTDDLGACRARLVDELGNELAISAVFHDSDAAARGIYTFREIAASGLIEDHTDNS